MPTQPRMSLRTIDFNPTPFKPVEFTPQRVEYGRLLGDAFKTIENRETQMTEKSAAMDVAFSQMKDTLPNDEETLKWFDAFTQKYKDRVQYYADTMDLSGAVQAATTAASDALNAAEYTGRRRYYQERKEWVDSLEKRSDLTSRDKDYWKRHYPQDYKDVTDETGKIIGGNHFEAPTPIKSIDWEAAIKSADENVAEDVQGSQSSSSYTSDTGGRSSGSSRVTKKKPLNKLVQGLREYMRKNPEIGKQFDVAYAEMKDDYDDLVSARDKYQPGTQEYENANMELTLFLNRIGSRNGGLPDKAAWFEFNVTNSEYAKLHAYENVQSGTESSKSTVTQGKALVNAQNAANKDYYDYTRPKPGNVDPEEGKDTEQTIEIGTSGVRIPNFVG